MPFPAWCELPHAELVRLRPGDDREFERRGARERVAVVTGRCELTDGAVVLSSCRPVVLRGVPGRKAALDDPRGAFAVGRVSEPTTIVRLAGRWGDETGGYGVVAVEERPDAAARGDAVGYPKRTGIDRHYHACDEYGIVGEGRGVAVSGDRHYPGTTPSCCSRARTAATSRSRPIRGVGGMGSTAAAPSPAAWRPPVALAGRLVPRATRGRSLAR